MNILNISLMVFCLFAASASFCNAQTIRQPPPPPLTESDRGNSNESRTFAALAEEMRAKREIYAIDKAHKENLSRARGLAFLGASLLSEFRQKRVLGPENIKQLDKAEKLAKGIRNAAGGSDDDFQIEKPPADLTAALTQLSAATDSLKNRVEKTPKRVISAAIIEEANVILELIRIVRTLYSKA